MAENTISFKQVLKIGTFGSVVDLINENFDLAKTAILQMKGKSAYQLWLEYMGDGSLTEDDFFAYLSADKGFTKQVVASYSALPSPASADTNTLYIYPNSQHTQYTTVISNGVDGWITLLVNDGDITNVVARISQIEGNIGSIIWEGVAFISNNGLVSISDGEIYAETGKTIETSDYRNTEIDVAGKGYTKIRFLERKFTHAWGYGFVLSDGTFDGTQGNSGDTIEVEVPPNAIAFKTCWWKTEKQNIEVQKSSLVTDRLSKRIDENAALINGLRDNVVELYDRMGTESFEDIQYTTIEDTVVHSESGSLIETSGYYSVEISLLGTSYSKIKFKTWPFTNPRGYGFVFSDGNWEGVHMTKAMYDESKELIVKIPNNAVTFKTCWTSANWFTQYIQGLVSQSVFVNLQRQINDNVSSIGELHTSISDLSKKLGSDVWETVEFTPQVGLINSEDGTVDTTASTAAQYRYALIDLSEGEYKKVSFVPRAFKGYYGYGFVLSDGTTFDGTRGTITQKDPIEVEIPNGAVAFKTCWYSTQNQVIRLLTTQDNYVNLQEQMDVLRSEIENDDKEGYTFNPFTVSVPDCKDIIPNLTVSSLYQLWDDLIEDSKICFNPTQPNEANKVYANKYLRSTNIGYDESGTYMMRVIELGIKTGLDSTYDTSITYPRKKVIVVANIHGRGGDSHIPAYTMYWLAKYILENRDTDTFAQWLLSNFYFVIVPIGNPWGFMNSTRGNSNNIDLNRNFDADFVPNADPYSSGITGGTTAASEAETQNIQSVIDDNSDAWMYVDFHSQPEPYGNSTWKRDRLQYLPKSGNDTLMNQCKKIREYSRAVANDWIEVAGSNDGGMSKQYAIKKGIERSLTIEAAAWHPDEHRSENNSYVCFGPKAMTAAARLFLSLLRFEN